MANQYSSSVTASQVGSYFVQQYYQVLQQQPEFVHQFYADSSTMVRVDGESTETASAIFQIHSLVQSLHFSGIEEKGYFVMNDIFHFVSEEVTHQHPQPTPVETKVDSLPISSTPHELQVGEDELEVETRENINSLNLEGNYEEDDYYNASHETQHLQQHEEEYESEGYEEEPQLEEEPQNTVDYVEEPTHYNTVDVQEPTHYNAVEYVQEPVPVVEEPIAEPVKFTYASILRSKGKTSPSVPTQPPINKSVPAATSEWDWSPEPVAQPPPVSYVPEPITQVPQESYNNEEVDSKSVYVRNLPTTVTSLEIFQEFKNFGQIKQDGVFLKNRKDVGVCFAFVEFEDAEGVQKAIEASPIQLAGRQVYIEERRANSSGASRGGRGGGRGAGRGRGDAPRGRYGGAYARGNGFR
nr:putative G3BP-like protein [Tanacetum cinerariifolium]